MKKAAASACEGPGVHDEVVDRIYCQAGTFRDTIIARHTCEACGHVRSEHKSVREACKNFIGKNKRRILAICPSCKKRTCLLHVRVYYYGVRQAIGLAREVVEEAPPGYSFLCSDCDMQHRAKILAALDNT